LVLGFPFVYIAVEIMRIHIVGGVAFVKKRIVKIAHKGQGKALVDISLL